MSKRTILIISIVAALLIVVALVSHKKGGVEAENGVEKGGMSIAPAKGKNGGGKKMREQANLEEARDRVAKKLARIEKMSREEWKEFHANNPKSPDTQEQAIKNNKERLAKLEAQLGAKTDGDAPATERLPDVPPKEAAPEK